MLSPADVRARVETDLSDAALQSVIDAEEAEVTRRVGPGTGSITRELDGRCRMLMLPYPLDEGKTIEVTEFITAEAADVELATESEEWWPDVGLTETKLASNDYRIRYNGRTLERLYTGTNPRVYWGIRVLVKYTPQSVGDADRRSEVTMKLVLLSLAYDGYTSTRVGDVTLTKGLTSAAAGSPLIYADERDRLLASLSTASGLLLR